MKRLIHIVSSLNVGGAEKFVKNLSIEQLAQGQKVEIISFGKQSDVFQPSLTHAGINITNLAEGLFTRLKQLIYIFKNVDIIHIHSPAVIRAILPIFPVLLYKKVIYTIHGEVDPPQSLIKLSHQVSLLYLNRILAVSQSAKESVERRYGWNSSRVGVIKNGVNVVSKLEKPEDNSKIRLGIVSRLIPLKNIPLLFEAIALLPSFVSQNITLHIFGDGPSFKEINEKSQQLPHAVEVDFYGNVVEESNIYTKFDILVMCSNTEGLPMSILEAMGYGIPIISTDVGAISQVVIDQQTGWLYPAKNVNALVDILNNVISKPESILVNGKRAKNFIDEHYAISIVSEDYQRIYEA
tara:strand:+ start:6499 stop:7554 length:1056 start_codon:yes stop_codon:yes gene_type:complete